jgi:hypothetical protein
VIGLHDQSLGAPVGPVDLAVEIRSDGGAAGASVGWRRVLRSGSHGWRADAGASVGVVVPLIEPSVGLGLTGWASAGVVGRRGYLQGLLAVPIATSVAQGLRIPLQPEVHGGVVAGPFLVGPRLGLGVVISPGTDVSFATEAAIGLSYRR